MIDYSDEIADGEKLKEIVAGKYQVKELYLTPYSPGMAFHVGPVLLIIFQVDR
jgi:hypothetical protein